jgi:hypothetical protein
MGTHDLGFHVELVREAAEGLGHLPAFGRRPERRAHRLQRRLECDKRFLVFCIHDEEPML